MVGFRWGSKIKFLHRYRRQFFFFRINALLYDCQIMCSIVFVSGMGGSMEGGSTDIGSGSGKRAAAANERQQRPRIGILTVLRLPPPPPPPPPPPLPLPCQRDTLDIPRVNEGAFRSSHLLEEKEEAVDYPRRRIHTTRAGKQR